MLKDLTIPLFTGAIGYVTNWTGVWMLFYPVQFAGWRVPGLSKLAPLLPRRIQQLPDIVRSVTAEIGDHIDQLLDIKLMVIRRIEENPEMANRIYLEVGRRELRLIINFGFLFGALQGIPLVFLTNAIPHWWVLPIGGVIIGWVTNWVALWMIFEPVEPRRIGPLKLHGLFIRRQPEVSGVYGEIIAEDIVTLGNIGDELLHGPRADRTRQMIEDAMRPAIDRAAGPARLAFQVAPGPGQ